MFFKLFAVFQMNLHDGGPFFGKVFFDVDIFLKDHFPHQCFDQRRMETVAGELIEAGRAVGQGHRGSIGHGELRVHHIRWGIFSFSRLAHQRPSGFQNGDFDALDLLGMNIILRGKLDQSVDGSLHVTATRVGLDAGPHDFKILSQVLRNEVGLCLSRVRPQETVAAFENRGGSFKTLRGKIRGQDSVLRGESRVQPLGPCSIRQELQGTGGHAAGYAHGGKHLLLAQAQKFGRGHCRAENAAGRRGMESQFVVRFRLERHSQARGDFVSGDDRGHKLSNVDVGMNFTQRDGCRKHHDAWMDGTGLMGVVKFHAVGRGAVRQRREFRRGLRGRTNYGTWATGRRPSQHTVDRLGGFRERAGDCDAKIVEEQILGALDDFTAQILGIERVRKKHKRPSYRVHDFTVPRNTGLR